MGPEPLTADRPHYFGSWLPYSDEHYRLWLEGEEIRKRVHKECDLQTSGTTISAGGSRPIAFGHCVYTPLGQYYYMIGWWYHSEDDKEYGEAYTFDPKKHRDIQEIVRVLLVRREHMLGSNPPIVNENEELSLGDLDELLQEYAS